MREIFSAEETNLMCIYGTGSREALITSLVAGLHDVDDLEMIAVFVSAIEKLETITDDEFADIGFYIADDDYNDGGEET